MEAVIKSQNETAYQETVTPLPEQTEKLFTAQDQIKIVKVLGNEEEVYDKGKFNLAIQYLLINNQNIELEKETLDNFRKIFDFLRNKFDELENVTN